MSNITLPNQLSKEVQPDANQSSRHAMLNIYRRVKAAFEADEDTESVDNMAQEISLESEEKDWDEDFLTWTDEDLAGLEVFPL